MDLDAQERSKGKLELRRSSEKMSLGNGGAKILNGG